MHQQAIEQRAVGAGLQSQEQVGVAGGVGAARIDHDDARAALLFVGEHALEQHRMAPGGVGAGQHQQVGLVEILVATRHGIGAERAAVAGDRRRHAQPRIGVDIGAADEPLHQFVGDVIVLGQQLPREIKRHRAGAVARDDVMQAVGDVVERVAPGHAFHDSLGPLVATDHRMEQTARKAERFAERRSLGAQPSEIGGMLGIAGNRSTAIAVGRCQHAAADAAIGTGGARGAQGGIDHRHGRSRFIKLCGLALDSRRGGRTSCRGELRRRGCGRGSIRDTRAHR